MNIKYIKDNYYFETLTEKHDTSNFKTSNTDLNEFLINDALYKQKNKFNVTKLVICDDEIIGYFSLLTDTLVLNKIRDNKLKTDIKQKLQTRNDYCPQ